MQMSIFKQPVNRKVMITLLVIISLFSIWEMIMGTPKNVQIDTDSHAYLRTSKLSLLDKGFYINGKVTILFFYKLAHSNPNIIILIQKILYALASTFLAISTLLLIKENLSKSIGFMLVLLFTFWWNIIGWNNIILSESIAHSFLFLWLATYILMVKYRSKVIFFFHLIIALLFAHTRDQWIILMIIFYFISLAYTYKKNKFQIKMAVFLFFFAIAVLIGNSYFLLGSKKNSFPLKNVIFQRILVNDNYLNWFIKHGMPYNNNFIKWKGAWAGSFNGELTRKPEYDTFNTWVDVNGEKALGIFIMTHPNYFLKTYLNEVGKTLTYNLFYVRNPPENKLIYFSNKTFPLFNLSLLFILSLITVVNIKRTNYHFEFLFPLILIILSMCNGIICLHLDPMEIERHTIANQIFLQYSGIILFINLISVVVKPEIYRDPKIDISLK